VVTADHQANHWLGEYEIKEIETYFRFEHMFLLMYILICISLLGWHTYHWRKQAATRRLHWYAIYGAYFASQFAFLNGAELFFLFFHTGPRNYGKDLLTKFSPKEYSQLTVNPMTSNNMSFAYLVHMIQSFGFMYMDYMSLTVALTLCTRMYSER
jgi:hypothetical protein